MPSEWKPIDTAPKDGSVFLIGYDSPLEIEPAEKVWEARWHEGEQAFTSRNGAIVHSKATHWRPMPDGPQESARLTEETPDADA